MRENEIRAVFFDAVGTLLFPRVPVSRTYAECAKRYGLELDEPHVRSAFRRAFAHEEKQDIQDNGRTDEARERARWQSIVNKVLPVADREGCFAELWNGFSQPSAWAVNPEASTVLTQLARRGLILGVASNFDSRLFSLVGQIPELANIRDRCVVSSVVGWRKPAPRFFEAVVRAADVPAQCILFVGDDLRNDVQGAMAAGLRAILYDPDEKLENEHRIRRLRDLLTGCGVTS